MQFTVRHIVAFPILLLAATVAGQTSATFEGAAADTLFRQSRKAIGGEANVMSVTSLVMKGTVRVSMPDGGPPERGVELRLLLPDQYVRIETTKDWVKRSGFSGKTLLTEIRAQGQTNRPPANLWASLLRGERGRFARLLLGVGSIVTPEVWLTIRQPTGPTQAPRFEGAHAIATGAPNVLEATAEGNFMARVFYAASGVPLRVEYEASRRQIVTAFGDRRSVGALRLPHTMTTTVDGMPFEEITLSEIVVNAPLSASDFQIVK